MSKSCAKERSFDPLPCSSKKSERFFIPFFIWSNHSLPLIVSFAMDPFFPTNVPNSRGMELNPSLLGYSLFGILAETHTRAGIPSVLFTIFLYTAHLTATAGAGALFRDVPPGDRAHRHNLQLRRRSHRASRGRTMATGRRACEANVRVGSIPGQYHVQLPNCGLRERGSVEASAVGAQGHEEAGHAVRHRGVFFGDLGLRRGGAVGVLCW